MSGRRSRLVAAPLALAALLAVAVSAGEPAAAAPAAEPARVQAREPQVVVRPGRVDLVERGGVLVGMVPFDGRAATLPALAAALAGGARPDWVVEAPEGTFLLRATLVQAPGTRLLVRPPEVREVRLAPPGNGIRAYRAAATFEGVRIISWDPARDRPLRDPSAPRPALVYGEGASLRLSRAELAWLGSTRGGRGTGVTWSAASGAALHSRFHHNAAGAEALRGSRVSIVASSFDDNAGNGLTLHGAGALPAVQRNLVRRNRGDGIVLLDATGALVWGNTVRDNRVGIRVGRRSARVRVEGNALDRNRRGIEVYDGARDTVLVGNKVNGSTEAGIVLEGTGTASRDDQVSDSPIAVDVRGLARLDATGVVGSVRGIVVGGRGIARIDRAAIASSAVALEVSPGSVVRVHRSRLHAPSPIGGSPVEAVGNDLGTLPAPAPLPWLALAGLGFLLLAVVLQIIHRARNPALERKESGRALETP